MLNLPDEKAKADKLADYRRNGAARYAQTSPIDEERLKANVDEGACYDGNHGMERLSLEAQLHVEHERAAHEGCA